MFTENFLIRGALLSACALGMMAVSPLSHAASLDEIVVTATKRAQSEQDISISIETITAEKLTETGIKDFEDLAEDIPNFFIADGVTSASVAIRGFGSGTDRSFEQSVSMYIDGIHMPRSRQYRSPFFDAERVEVVRGPQAVLFGQNSTAGAISVVSAKTRPGDDPFVEITGGYESEYDGYRVSGIAGLSLGDNLGLRLAVQQNDSGDGYIDNGFSNTKNGGSEETLIRGTLVWQPNDDTTVTFKYENTEFNIIGSIAELYSSSSTSPSFSDGDDELNWRTSYDASIIAALGIKDGLFQNLDNMALTVETPVGGHDLTIAAGFSDYEYTFGTELDFSPVTVLDALLEEEYEQTNVEVRLASPLGQKFEYIIGAYYAEGELFNDQPSYLSLAVYGVPGGVFEESSAISTIDSDTMAVFGIGTLNLSDDRRLIGGLRYNREEKKLVRDGRCNHFLLDGTVVGPGAFLCPDVNNANLSRTSSNLLPELTFEYDVNDNSLFYAKAAQSTKSGGFVFSSSVPTVSQIEYDDETATNFEIGMKSTFWDNRGLLNFGIFKTEFEDLQLNSFVPDETNPTELVSVTTNAGKATSEGIEAEFNYAANDWVLLTASVSYINAEFDEHSNAPCHVNDPTENAGGKDCNHSGMSLPFAAEFQSNIGIDIDKPISSNLRLIGGANVTSSSSYLTDGTLDPAAEQGSYEKFNARIGLRDADDAWDILLIGRNLSDEQVLNVTQPGIFGGYIGYTGRPRTVHLQGRVRF